MTQPRDIERLLDQWFADGSSVAPDRVVDIVADRIERQPQRPAWRLDWRHSSMNPLAKAVVAIAAVVVVALVGYNLLPGGSTGVGAPASPAASSSPAASASPSAAPSANAVFPSWFTPSSPAAGILPAGSQTTKSFVAPFTFTVPEGWVNSSDEAGFYGLFPDTSVNAAQHAASGSLAQEIFMGPHDSPYFVCEAVENNRGTAAEMVAAAAANEALAVSNVVDVTMGSLTGKRFDVRADPDWKGPCPGDPPGLDLQDQRTRGFLLDTPDRGVIVIFVTSLHSAGHEAFLAEAMPIIDSIKFSK